MNTDNQITLSIGQHLFTKDGRIRTNAIVTAVIACPTLGTVYGIETDFGNRSKLTTQEINGWYHVTSPNGLAITSAVHEWREDSMSLKRAALAAEMEAEFAAELEDEPLPDFDTYPEPEPYEPEWMDSEIAEMEAEPPFEAGVDPYETDEFRDGLGYSDWIELSGH